MFNHMEKRYAEKISMHQQGDGSCGKQSSVEGSEAGGNLNAGFSLDATPDRLSKACAKQ